MRRRRGEDLERKEEDGEDGNVNRGGGERTLRGGKRTERTEEEWKRRGTGLLGGRNGNLNGTKQGL